MYRLRSACASGASEVPRFDIQLRGSCFDARDGDVRIRDRINFHGVTHLFVARVVFNTPTPVRVLWVDVFYTFVDSDAEEVVGCRSYTSVIKNVRDFLFKGEGVGDEKTIFHKTKCVAVIFPREGVTAAHEIEDFDIKYIIDALRGKVKVAEELNNLLLDVFPDENDARITKEFN